MPQKLTASGGMAPRTVARKSGGPSGLSKVVRSFGLPFRMPLDARLANNRGES